MGGCAFAGLADSSPTKPSISANPPRSAAQVSRKRSLSSSGSAEDLQKQVLGKYALGKVLGRGASGVVYRSKHQETREEFAVKIIVKAETPLSTIMREVDMLRKLAHPCVARLHDVYCDKNFLFVVQELYKGGNMVDGMERHWKSKGAIAIPVVQNMAKMMVQSVRWLHQLSIAHRDLKGDNILMDQREIDSPSCRIYLSDFGTAVELQWNQRLSQKCGSSLHWAPEFYARNYGIAVDIWAIGVITFGLATSRFPFLNEEECRKKVVKCPPYITKDGEAFILASLARAESRRLTAQQALEHAFLSSIRSAAQAAVDMFESGLKRGLNDRDVDASVQECHRQLGERFPIAQRKASVSIVDKEHADEGIFHVGDMRQERRDTIESEGERE